MILKQKRCIKPNKDLDDTTGHPSYLRSLLSLTPHRSTCSSSLITLNRPSVPSGQKMSNRSFFHSAPVLCNSLPSHLRHSAHHSTSSSPTYGFYTSDLSTSVFLKKLKFHLFRISFPLLSCTHLGFTRRISLVLTLLGPFIYFHFVSAHIHVIHQHNFLFDFTTQVFKNNLSLIC